MEKGKKKIIIVTAAVVLALVILLLGVFRAVSRNKVTEAELKEIFNDPSSISGIYRLSGELTDEFEGFDPSRITDIQKADGDPGTSEKTDTILCIEATRTRVKNKSVAIYLYFGEGSDTVDIYCKGQNFTAKVK